MQVGSLDSFLGALPPGSDVGQAGELEFGFSKAGFNIPMDISPEGNWRPLGAGGNVGIGAYFGVNAVAGVRAGQPFQLFDPNNMSLNVVPKRPGGLLPG